jgi:hypothetical protein
VNRSKFKAHQQAKGEAEMKNSSAIKIGVLLIAIVFLQTACSKISSAEQKEIVSSQPVAVSNETVPTSIPDPVTNPVQVTELNQSEENTRILNATIMIRMQSPQMEKVSGLGVFLGSGIGSFIQINGEILLVTHNHWGEMLQDLTIVEFRDADNQMIKPIFGKDFKTLILSQDAGTLILRPPQELIDQIVPVTLEAIPQVAAGEIVDLVYRENPAREKATIQQAVVEEIILFKDLPAYRLRSLDSQPIQPGDSGGGIWYKGALVGNSWVTLMEANGKAAVAFGDLADENLVFTDLSYAAILPLAFP